MEPVAAVVATEALRAENEKLTLLVAENKAGYFGLTLKHGRPKPYQVQVRRGGKMEHLGMFATAEEAALCPSCAQGDLSPRARIYSLCSWSIP